MDAVATAVKNESGSTDEQQYLTFMMSDEEYGVDILAVQEIRGWEESTLIPNAPEYIRGVTHPFWFKTCGIQSCNCRYHSKGRW